VTALAQCPGEVGNNMTACEVATLVQDEENRYIAAPLLECQLASTLLEMDYHHQAIACEIIVAGDSPVLRC
jgi:hypothetical protein